MADDKLIKPDQPVSEEDDIRRNVQRLLNRPVSDERRLLEIITEAITAKYTDQSVLEKAVKQVLYKYDNKMRVFMIAAAQRQLRRILRLIDTLDDMEEELSRKSRFAGMDDQDLIRLYTVTQANLTNSLDYVKKVVDLRMELAQAETSLLTAQTQAEVDAIAGLPSLNTQQRDRVRRVIQGITTEIIELDSGDVDIAGKGNEIIELDSDSSGTIDLGDIDAEDD